MEKKTVQSSSKICIAMYHYVRDLKHSRYPEIRGMDAGLFREQMLFFREHFHVVTMEETIRAVRDGEELPENSVLLTFDDGYVDNYTFVLPILEEFGMQGSFFIPGKTFTEHKLLDVNKIHYILASADCERILADLYNRMNYYRGTEFEYPSNEELFLEYGKPNRFDPGEVIFIKRMLQTVLPERLRNVISSELFAMHVGVSEEQLAYELYMTGDQIRTLKRHGMHIGIHGYDHYWLGRLSPEEMERDISRALEALGDLINPDCWVMNYPYGDATDEVREYVKEKGACLGLSTIVGQADIGQDDPMFLPRFDCNDFPPLSEGYYEYL